MIIYGLCLQGAPKLVCEKENSRHKQLGGGRARDVLTTERRQYGTVERMQAGGRVTQTQGAESQESGVSLGCDTFSCVLLSTYYVSGTVPVAFHEGLLFNSYHNE